MSRVTLLAGLFAALSAAACTDDDTSVSADTRADVVVETALDTSSPADAAQDTVADSIPRDTAMGTVAVADTAAVPDTAAITDTTAADPPHAWFGLSGEILLLETYSAGAGEVVNSGVGASIADGPDPLQHTRVGAVGDCELWIYQPTMCSPACALSETCDADSACVPFPTPQSAGVITVTGLKQAVTMGVSNGFYVIDGSPPSGALFGAGDEITASAPGDDIAAFSAQVVGVADFSVQGIGAVELSDSEDFTLSWAATAAAGDEVELLLQLGHHATPPAAIIYCRADDDAGSIVIDKTLIAGFPPFSGIGLFQHLSIGQRISRHIFDTAAGPIALTAASRQNLFVTH
ncbi:MAG: hypothetical protein ACI9MR_004667 [Myxococcota bacterium]|jgi:hypothetical protein